VKVSLNAWKVEMNIAGGRGSYTGYKSRNISRGTHSMTHWKESIVNSTRNHTQAIRVERFREELVLLNITILHSMVKKKRDFNLRTNGSPI
jgi:hypothetical protein